MQQLTDLLNQYNQELPEIRRMKNEFSKLVSASHIDKYLPDFHEYTETLYEFLDKYPHVAIKDFTEEDFKFTIMKDDEEKFKTALTTEMIFVKNRLYKPKNTCVITKYTVGNDVFYMLETIEKFGATDNIYICSFFRIKKGKICDVFTQLPTKYYKEKMNLDVFEYYLKYEVENDRDMIFDLPKEEIILNIAPEMLKLNTCSYDEYEKFIEKHFGKNKLFNKLSIEDIRKLLLRKYSEKIPTEIFKIIS